MEASNATQIMLLQHICKKCGDTYSNNPLDAEDPKNEAFLNVLKMASEAPKAYEERQRGGVPPVGGAVPPALGAVPPRSSRSSKKKYGILGCVILAAAVGTAAWVGFSKYNMPQPPPRR